jgi:hypothetical protein
MVTGRHFAIPAFLIPLFLCLPARGATPSILPMTEAQRGEAVFLDAMSIPCPGEVFVALNKVCRPNWATLVTPATAPVTTDRAQLALAVGVLAANGYIAVEAQDGQQVRNVGREIMSVAKALGVSQSLLGRGNSLMEFAENNAWEALADELEATENEVKATMVEQKDRDLVCMTSAAAWLRGFEIASGVVLATESLQGIEVIRQPELASKLAAQLGELPPRLKGGAQVALTREALDSVASLLKANGLSKQESRSTLQKIHDDCSVVVKSILTSATASGTTAPASAPSVSPVPSLSPKATGTNSSASVTK